MKYNGCDNGSNGVVAVVNADSGGRTMVAVMEIILIP